jgi:hypothetical protein
MVGRFRFRKTKPASALTGISTNQCGGPVFEIVENA